MSGDPLLALGQDLFTDPSRIAAIDRFPVLHPVRNPLHRHPDLLQLDVFLGCRGAWLTERGRIAVSGPAAAAFLPGAAHGHDFAPERAAGECLSLKLAWGGSPIPAFQAVVHDPGLAQLLATSARRAAAAQASGAVAQALAQLILLLGQWPRQGGAACPIPAEDIADRVMRSAIRQLAVAAVGPRTGRLAAAHGLSARQFGRRFRASLGCTPRAYSNRLLLERAQALLLQDDQGIATIAAELGFSSLHHFTRWFHRHAGTPPGGYRRQGLRL